LKNSDQRPNPDLLLKAVQKQEDKESRGKLKVFLGMAAGVGKTFDMLSAARELKSGGVDVAVGLVETHGRAETEALLQGLEIIPRRKIPYRDVELSEMDLDAVLRRRPKVALVDELAHTNAPGSRHARRFQDVLEILDAGIDVYTTLNVQHLESRTDTVREITGVRVAETVPDSIIDIADEVILVDLAPEELINRLREGKVYGVERADLAMQNFFQPGNLTALRELSLRMVAERVNQDLRDYQQVHHIDEAWKTQYRLMVAIYASPYSETLIRWTRRMAAGLNAYWYGAYVDLQQPLSEKERQLLSHNMALVKELGGEVLETVDGDTVAGLLRLARENQVTLLVVGKSRRGFFHNLSQGGSVNNRLLRESGKVDIYVVSGESQAQEPAPEKLIEKKPAPVNWNHYLTAAATPALIGIIGYLFNPLLQYRAIGLLFLLGVVVLGLFVERGPVLLAALLSALVWDYIFIPPRFTFAISAPEDIMMFAIYVAVAFTIGHLTTRLRNSERILLLREQRITALYQLTKEIASAESIEKVLDTAVKHLGVVFNAEVAVLVKVVGSELEPHPGNTLAMDDKEKVVAEWVALHNRPAGLFTDTLPSARAFYLPLTTNEGTVGVLGLRPRKRQRTTPDLMVLAETFARQLAVGISRERQNRPDPGPLGSQDPEKTK
jgi:two-component system, OmpR family, sensor histidine kinase KdpD